MLEQLPALYEQASSLNYKLDNSSEDWFNPDIPSEESFPWTADDLVLSEDVAIAMIEAGQTLWSHPSWVKDVGQILEEWERDGKLIRVRLTATWMLSTLPPAPPANDLGLKPQLPAGG